LYDNNGIIHPPSRQDIKIYLIEAAKESAMMGSTKTFNMLVLGAYLKIKPIVDMDNVTKGLKKSIPQRHHNLLGLNQQAIHRGQELVVPFN
jgi:2-oxoglutarate ferredoxin oxidoreductase subunit gamma